MKRLFGMIFLISVTLQVFSQNAEVYSIIKVDGEIVNKSTGKMLASGDKIKSTDQLEFRDSYSTAVVISSTRGKFTLRPAEQTDAFSDTKLLAMAGNAISPIDSRAQISTRSIGPMEVKDLSKYLGNTNFYLIGNSLWVKLSKTSYPLSPAMSIILSYKGQKEKISKKLPFNGQSISIVRDQIVNEPADLQKGNTLHEVSFYKFDNSSNQASLITTVNLVFLDPEQLKKEFDVILPILKEQNMERFETVDYLKGYFNDVYGTSDPDMLYLAINQEVNKFYNQ